MIHDKRMRLVKKESGICYYLFSPSFSSLYYNDKNAKHREEPSHRHSLSHKLHMLWYLVFAQGGYKILYAEQSGEILSYIIFTKANNWIIKDCEKNDYYTIFLWTYPEHRGKGLATKMSNLMLHQLSLPYNCFYKTISKDNLPSMRVAEKIGFCKKCDSVKTGWLHTIHPVCEGDQYLYCYCAE